MKSIGVTFCIALLLLLLLQRVSADEPVYPGATWETRAPGEVGLDATRLRALAARVGGRGCVVRHGSMVFTWGDVSKRGDVASAAKPWYAHFLFRAIEDGKIADVDERVSRREPRLATINADLEHKDAAITWRHLANQTSCYQLVERPGTAFAYNDWQMALLWDTLFVKVYGATYADVDEKVLRPLLADPLGCEDRPTMMAFGTGDRPGRLAVSVRDFARFGLLYLRGGRWKGRQLISREHARLAVSSPLPNSIPRAGTEAAEMIPGQRSIGSRRVPDNQTDHMGSYSWLWWTNGVDREGERHWPDAPVDAYGAFGHGGRRAMVVLPSLDLIISWNDSDVRGRDAENEVLRMLVAAVVASDADPADADPADADPADADPADADPADIVRVDDRASLVEAVGKARPGTRVLIAPGRYRGGLAFSALRGEPGRPIVIAGTDPADPPRIQGQSVGIYLGDPSWVELRDLVVESATGNGINIDDGGSFDSPASHIVLENVRVRDVGPDGNRDGIKLSGVTDFRVTRCVVQRWGSRGSAIDMVGCHRGEIESCVFSEGSAGGANGVQAKGGSRAITIRRCRFDDAGARAVNIGGSTGRQYFRPRPQGFEAREIVVEDCVFSGSTAPIAYVGVDGAIVRHNTIYRPRGWVLRILQETRADDFVPSRRGVFTRNIVAFRSDELRAVVNVGPGTAPETFEFAENVWFCIDRPGRTRELVSSLPTAERSGTHGEDPRFVDAEHGRLELRPDSPVRNAGPRAP